MPTSPGDPPTTRRRASGRVRRAAALALVVPALGLAVATGPAVAAPVPPVLAAAAPSSSASAASTGAVTPSPSPTPGQRPSGTVTAPTAGVGARDETGTGVVLPLLAGTAVGLVLLGVLFASAVTRRQREERRL